MPTHSILKTQDDHVTSTNKKVMECCTSLKEGTSKTVNKLFYLCESNKKKGIDGVTISDDDLAKSVDRKECSIRRYRQQIKKQGFFEITKVRTRKHKLRYHYKPTQKLLNIKKCGTGAPSNSLSFDTKTVQVAQKTVQLAQNTPPKNPLFSAGLRAVSEPLYLSISLKRLDSAREDVNQTSIESVETSLSSFGKKQPREPDKEEMEFLTGVEEINKNLPTPNRINAQSVLKAYRTLKKSHFGGIDKAKQYLEGFAHTPFVMGKKPTKTGDIFNAKLGYILSGKTIEQYWEKKGPFDVWPPKEVKQREKQEDFMKNTSEPAKTPFLSEMIVLEAAIDRIDESAKHYLYTKLGEPTYKSWFHNYGFTAIGMSGGEPEFTINSRFARDYITTHFREELKGAFAYAEEVAQTSR